MKKFTDKLTQLNIEFDVMGREGEEEVNFTVESATFVAYKNDDTYVIEADAKVEGEFVELGSKEYKRLGYIANFINEKACEANAMQPVEEINYCEVDVETGDIYTDNGIIKNENSAIENFKKQTSQNPEIAMNLTREEIMEQLKIAFEKMAMMEFCYMKHTGNHLLNEFHSNFTFTSPYEFKIFNAYHNEDLQRMEWLVENSDANLKNMNARFIIIKELHKQIAIFNANEMVSRGINAKQMQEEYEQANKETEESLQETITNAHGVTIKKEELEYIKQDTQKAIETFKSFEEITKKQEQTKRSAKVVIILPKSKHYIKEHGFEKFLDSDIVERYANRHEHNLADFVYQIVLAYNEISPIVTPIASKVETEELQSASHINTLFNDCELSEVGNMEIIDSRTLEIYGNEITYMIVDNSTYFELYETDSNGKDTKIKLINIESVIEHILIAEDLK